jgi:hypothetical protein
MAMPQVLEVVRHPYPDDATGSTPSERNTTVSEPIDELTTLEKRLVLEHTSALMAMAKQPPGLPFALAELSRIADIYTVLQAVRSELSMRQPHEGWSRP